MSHGRKVIRMEKCGNDGIGNAMRIETATKRRKHTTINEQLFGNNLHANESSDSEKMKTKTGEGISTWFSSHFAVAVVWMADVRCVKRSTSNVLSHSIWKKK